MNDEFILIGITMPGIVESESYQMMKLIESGFTMVHLRKPMMSEEAIRGLLDSYSPELMPYIRLHDYFHLAKEYGLNGVHLNQRNPIPPCGVGNISRSCHNIEELSAPWPKVDGCRPTYQTLSPIFDSISKRGYRSRFNLSELSDKIKGHNVVALGGITFDKLKSLQTVNFIGAAMLGVLWKKQ